MKWVWRGALFAVVLIAAFVAFAPARMFIQPQQREVAFTSVEGAIWQPVLRGLRIGRLEAGDAKLALSPVDLLFGRAVADVRLDGRDVNGVARLEFGMGGDLRIVAPDLVVTSQPGAGVLGFSGSARLTNVDIQYDAQACTGAQGDVSSDALAATAKLLGGAGPLLVGKVACAGRAARISLNGAQDDDAVEAWLDLGRDGTGTWMAAYTTRRREAAVGLIALGFAPRDASGRYETEGKMRWLPQ